MNQIYNSIVSNFHGIKYNLGSRYHFATDGRTHSADPEKQ
jgi:hypothetical protein